MYIKSRQFGFTLTEVMVAMGLGSLLFVAVGSMSIHSSRTFLVTSNYATINQESRVSLDIMSRDIRQADKVLSCSSNALVLASSTNTISFSYDPSARTVRRISGNRSQILVRDCDYVRYDMFQRNATNGTYDYYPTSSTNTCKVVQVMIACSKPVYGTSRKDMAVQQSAKVVIRKQR
jgi:prepilin-type N-terminal cleavage/methylation domain-containing protein